MNTGLMKARFLVDVNVLAEGKTCEDDDRYKDCKSYHFTKMVDIPVGYPPKGQKFYFEDLNSFLDSGIEVSGCWFVNDGDITNNPWVAEIICTEINLKSNELYFVHCFAKSGWSLVKEPNKPAKKLA
jgi:hypothetical protein